MVIFGQYLKLGLYPYSDYDVDSIIWTNFDSIIFEDFLFLSNYFFYNEELVNIDYYLKSLIIN